MELEQKMLERLKGRALSEGIKWENISIFITHDDATSIRYNHIYIGEFLVHLGKYFLGRYVIDAFQSKYGLQKTEDFEEFTNIIDKWIEYICFIESKEYSEQRDLSFGRKFEYRPSKSIQAALSRPLKGEGLLLILQDFTVIDIETTGLDPSVDEIIEIGALKVRDGKVVATFHTLVKPDHEVSDFIERLTGITNESLGSAPDANNALLGFNEFIGEDILVGHNVHFDINFLYDTSMKCLSMSIENNFIDTLRFSRRITHGLKNFKLETLAEYFGVEVIESHRAIADCETTLGVYQGICRFIKSKDLDLNNLPKQEKRIAKSIKLSDFKAQSDDIDETHELFEKMIVFTGALATMTREKAVQLAVNVGAIPKTGVSKNTNYLVLGNLDYAKHNLKDSKSSKQKKAEELILKGHDLQIISENTFLDMISE